MRDGMFSIEFAYLGCLGSFYGLYYFFLGGLEVR